ncbi:MAG: methionine ABC transporter ATP-binding protein [Erysipelotrichaceae bacterium]|jgi:D-methionine transport system ATP-binding protein|nr:methionine ABC transporter ATP-binding protein [Erysipelotrichaceae bacterium]MBQ1624651.1 methionine ABC transporter ATP-binding protein [Erysipelotrichaceae bacterium]MBQ2506624.1 methionine ABC transporter ATP-binding protein [Erysipelotrichaceae bacterium]MBQ3993746.1 methionine ABC transporter ATP-binding protein [Erysipelotrichaceae bacterium]MBQ9158681.1 methionine ABC transporter ATP-binding protein [Erysipelotrichaceae bacterium]
MIKLENVSKSFGDLEVLKDISIEIADHEIFGIIGQSGAGKSTLLRCINGLEDYQSGRIEVDGVEVSLKDKKKLHLLQKNMGMIFQNFNLLERLDVYDNVALPMKFWGMKTKTPEARKKIEGLISLVGLEDKIHARPKELSGGQKQRVAIARALVLDPKILLCDEATSALDPAITRGILDLLQKINKEMGITIIVVTHQMEVVKQICEKVAFIKNGRVVQIGKPEELFIRPNKDIKAFLHEDSELLPEEGVNIQLFFTDESADEPVISNMARKLDADFSISWAKLEDFRSHVYGSLVINIKEEDKEKITAYLDEVKVLWEVLN